jgi:hypothetical protein
MSMDGKFDVIGQLKPDTDPVLDGKVAEEEEDYENASSQEPESSRLKAFLQAQQDTLLRKRENQLEADKLQERKTIRKLRVGIAGSIFVLIFLWLIGVIWLVFLGSYEIQYLHGVCADYNIHSFYDKFKVLPSGCELISDAKTTYLKLPEPIMIALISTTTINVLGLAYIVANWLFPSEKNHAAPVLPSEQK